MGLSVPVAQPPEVTVVLAASDTCRIQAMGIGNKAWSLQYHVEVELDTVANWARVDAYRASLEKTFGQGAVERMKADANIPCFANNAEKLYRNFMATISRPAAKNRLL